MRLGQKANGALWKRKKCEEAKKNALYVVKKKNWNGKKLDEWWKRQTQESLPKSRGKGQIGVVR